MRYIKQVIIYPKVRTDFIYTEDIPHEHINALYYDYESEEFIPMCITGIYWFPSGYTIEFHYEFNTPERKDVRGVDNKKYGYYITCNPRKMEVIIPITKVFFYDEQTYRKKYLLNGHYTDINS